MFLFFPNENLKRKYGNNETKLDDEEYNKEEIEAINPKLAKIWCKERGIDPTGDKRLNKTWLE